MRLNSLLHHFNVAALRPRAAANSAAVFPLDRHSRTRLAHNALVVVSMRDDYVAFVDHNVRTVASALQAAAGKSADGKPGDGPSQPK